MKVGLFRDKKVTMLIKENLVCGMRQKEAFNSGFWRESLWFNDKRSSKKNDINSKAKAKEK